MPKKTDRPPLSVILPTLNEAGNIKTLVRQIIESVSPEEILVIDDGSADGTIKEVRSLEKIYPRVRLTVNKPRLGLTGSIQKGIDISKGRLVAWMDADLSHPPQLLKKMAGRIKISDIVSGSWLAQGGNDRRSEIQVKIMSFTVNKSCQILFDRRITAYTSGYIMAKRSVLDKIRLKGDYGEYCINFLVRASGMKMKMSEIPFDCFSRTKGRTKTSPGILVYIGRGLKYLQTVISLKITGN